MKLHHARHALLLAPLLGWGGLASAQAQAEPVYQLGLMDLVRWDNPRIQVELHPEWILDAPPRIDKRDFRDPWGGRWKRDEILVRFRPGTTSDQKAAARLAVSGSQVVWESQMVPDLVQVRLDGWSVPEAVNAYLDLDQVLYAEPSYLQSLDVTVPNDPLYGSLWGMNGPNGIWAPWAWSEFTGDPDFVVAVIDTGVELPHVDLLSNQWNNWAEINGTAGVDDDDNGKIDDFHGWNVHDNNNDVTSCGDDHGTHVAGTIGAHGNNGQGVSGVNWRCKIMALRCNGPDSQCDPDGPEGPNVPYSDPCCGLSNVHQALDYAVANGARVSNHSYGGYSWDSKSQQAFQDIVLAAQAPGHIVVASAGNDDTNNDTKPHYPDSIPLQNIISVTAIDESGAQDYNYGATSVDLGAPGKSITSTTIGGYTAKNGTSMATPHVTGAVALVWGRYPELTWFEVKTRILEATLPTTSLLGKTVTGGRLYLPRALGVWMSPFGGAGLGTIDFPYGSGDWSTAYGSTPSFGSLNLYPGSVGLGQMSGVTTLGKPMTISAKGGLVTLGN